MHIISGRSPARLDAVIDPKNEDNSSAANAPYIAEVTSVFSATITAAVIIAATKDITRLTNKPIPMAGTIPALRFLI